MSPAQRRGSSPLPAALPVGARLTEAFAGSIANLSPAARRAATLAAASLDAEAGPRRQRHPGGDRTARRAACHETQDQEAVELGAELGYVVDVSIAQELLARELAARGCHEQAQDALRAARRLQERAEVAAAAVHIELVEAFCALCSGDLPRVIAVLEHRITLTAGASLAANIRSRWRLT